MDQQEQEFWNAIEAAPDEMTVRLAFADWLDEQGDERGPGMRALAEMGKYPINLHEHLPPGDRETAISEGGIRSRSFLAAATMSHTTSRGVCTSIALSLPGGSMRPSRN